MCALVVPLLAPALLTLCLCLCVGSMSGRQRRVTVFETPRDTNAVLDIGKVADIVVFVLGSSPQVTAAGGAGAIGVDALDVDDFGLHAVTILKAQGMPAVLGMQVGLGGLVPKKLSALKDLGGRFFATSLGVDTKVITMSSADEASQFFRWVASDMKLKPLAWRDTRPYLLAHQIAFEPNVAPAMPAVPQVGQFSFTSAPAPAAAAVSSTAGCGTLALRGFLRGDNPLSPNQLLHLTGYGDFQIDRIEGRVENAPVYLTEKEKKQSRAASKAASKMGSRRGSIGGDADGDLGMGGAAAAASSSSISPSPAFQLSPHAGVSGGDVVLQRAVPASQEGLDGLVPLDPLAHEQSLIEDDELADEGPDDEEDAAYENEDDDGGDMMDEHGDTSMDGAASSSAASRKPVKKRAGAKDTSGAIIPHSSRRRPLNEAGAAAAHAAKLKAANKPGALVRSQVAWDAAVPRDDDGFDAEMEQGLQYDESIVPDLVEKRKLERDEQSHPDEIEFPMDTQCRTRFARYRGLKSFKDSRWDSKENLPLEYGQIVQFQNFEASRNRVVKHAQLGDEEGGLDETNCVLTQRFHPVTIFLRDVPAHAAASIVSTLSPIVCFGLFKYEHKVSVLHFSVKRANEYTLPIKAKEPMEFHVAFRRFVARPIYSLEGKADKSPTQRFFQMGSFAVASVYGRIVFPPAPVIMFKPNAGIREMVAAGATSSSAASSSSSAMSLAQALVPAPLLTKVSPFHPAHSSIVAGGTLLSVNPDRLLIKRIVLTGTPISVHKRNAVVRHMFFNADDIRYFKPVELYTKAGMVGHIKESRGTKGYMKCEFDKYIAQNDIVCMALYKRQFPPWNEQLFAGNL